MALGLIFTLFFFSSCQAPRVTCDLWKESGDVSDSGSSTTSGHWSAECGASTPSPPHTEASPKYTNEAFSASHVDEGFETDPDPFLLDEPAPRKRKVWHGSSIGGNKATNVSKLLVFYWVNQLDTECATKPPKNHCWQFTAVKMTAGSYCWAPITLDPSVFGHFAHFCACTPT